MGNDLAKVFDEICILKGTNSIFIKSMDAIVVGDMHMGMESKFERMGVHFRHAASLNAQAIAKACSLVGANKIIFLGDVKDAIGFPDTLELDALKDFFSQLDKQEIMIAKGNHDGHLAEILDRIGVDAKMEREILLDDFAFMHGNSIPSKSALAKKYLFSAHGHFAIRRDGVLKKVFIVSKRPKGNNDNGKYAGVGNRAGRMIMLPAFNSLIYGTEITRLTINAMPIFRNKIFDFDSAIVLDAQGKKIGYAKEVAKEQEAIKLNRI